jgi:hypothetical protein
VSATQNTRIVTNETLAEISKHAHVRKLMQFSRATGYSPSQILNRAVENFMNIEPLSIWLMRSRDSTRKHSASSSTSRAASKRAAPFRWYAYSGLEKKSCSPRPARRDSRGGKV